MKKAFLVAIGFLAAVARAGSADGNSLSADIWTLAAGPNQTLYIGKNFEGVYRSRDDGATWMPAGSGLRFT
ncbi:MAG: hypothetical protein HYW49_04290, partial [Deltaproteobacteria bacterium]|nr:hypothetical protein [Deltaproteobacteria bacterium]